MKPSARSSSHHVAVLQKEAVVADVFLFDGKKVTGAFFLSQCAPTHGGPETLLELLNDDERSFVPFQCSSELMFLQRAAIRYVDFESRALAQLFLSPDNMDIYALKVVLRTETQGLSMAGFCYTGDLPPENRRPIDLLNARAMFLLLFHDSKLTLVNKNAISHAILG
jgi:hypothetical protein